MRTDSFTALTSAQEQFVTLQMSGSSKYGKARYSRFWRTSFRVSYKVCQRKKWSSSSNTESKVAQPTQQKGSWALQKTDQHSMGIRKDLFENQLPNLSLILSRILWYVGGSKSWLQTTLQLWLSLWNTTLRNSMRVSLTLKTTFSSNFLGSTDQSGTKRCNKLRSYSSKRAMQMRETGSACLYGGLQLQVILQELHWSTRSIV